MKFKYVGLHEAIAYRSQRRPSLLQRIAEF